MVGDRTLTNGFAIVCMRTGVRFIEPDKNELFEFNTLLATGEFGVFGVELQNV